MPTRRNPDDDSYAEDRAHARRGGFLSEREQADLSDARAAVDEAAAERWAS